MAAQADRPLHLSLDVVVELVLPIGGSVAVSVQVEEPAVDPRFRQTEQLGEQPTGRRRPEGEGLQGRARARSVSTRQVVAGGTVFI
ncbi:hypothetical protein [Streptomyces sp. DSM 40907]|uniref:hypothetical protein n=1 Tax=Streptomyces kutzneri TaxID=3051179 RepID=UPI0028D7DF14|nr:hypothetical protein [Streptomyces sp. DSM 40907]